MPRVPLISNVNQIVGNIRRSEKQIASGIERGVKLAGLRLLRESQRLVPVETGNLKASGFVRSSGKGFKTMSNVGYTAGYALYVHEKTEMKLKGQPRQGGRGRYWDPQGRAQAKFLEEPARRLRPELRRIIRENARIK